MTGMLYDAIIIGGGVIGSAIARELARFEGNFCLIEKNEDVCTGTSKANSAIVHAGFDAKNGTLMAKMNVKGNEMMGEVAKELDIPFKRNGAFVLCFDKKDLGSLQELYERGINNGVKDLQILTREEALKLEPNLSDLVVAALYAPTSGIICPFALTIGLAENAADNGVEFKFNTPANKIEKTDFGYRIYSDNEVLETKAIVNAAGVYADEIHNMVCEDKLKIVPRKGEYILCDKKVGNICERTLFQLPTKLGKGILVSPTVHGNLILGPTATDIEDKEGIDTTKEGLDSVIEKASLSVKSVPVRSAITSFSGLRAHINHDFILAESADNFFDATGIESPGLSSAPAIGIHMADMVSKKLALNKKDNFNPIRKGIIHASELSNEERAALIEKEPAYGQIICRCEMISEGEILSAIHRTLGATTLDGVKRRTRAGMGRCQAGFCSPKVMEILSRELNLPLDEIKKNGGESKLAVGKSNKGI